MGKNSSTGSSATINITETINAVTAARQAAAEAAANASAAAVNVFQTEEASIVSQMEALAGQLGQLHAGLESVGIEEFSVPDLSEIDYLFTNAVRSTPKRKGRGPGRPRGSKTASTASTASTATVRGSKPCSLPDAILIGMNAFEQGTEFSIAEVADAVQADPINYPFSGSDKSMQVTINQNLSTLTNGKFIKRASRGVYVITASGSKAAAVALTELEASVEAVEAAE